MTSSLDVFPNSAGSYTIAELNTLFTNLATAVNSKLSEGGQLTGSLEFGDERAVNGKDVSRMDSPITLGQARDIVGYKGGKQLEYWHSVYGGNPTAVVLGSTADIDGLYTATDSTWPYLLETKIRAARGLSSDFGSYYSAALSSVPDPLSLSGGAASDRDSSGIALVTAVFKENDIADAQFFSFDGTTGFDVFYSKGYDTGDFEVFVGEKSYGVASGFEAGLLNPSSGSNVFKVRGIAQGANQLAKLQKIPSELATHIEGVQLYTGDEKEGGNPGVHVVHGSNSSNLTSTWSVFEGATPNLTKEALSAHKTDLLILNPAMVDYYFGTPKEAVKANMLSILRSYRRARENGSVLVISPWGTGLFPGVTQVFADWKEMYKEVAREGGAAILDLDPVIGDLSSGSNPYHPAADTINLFLNDAGHAAVATAVYGAIKP